MPQSDSSVSWEGEECELPENRMAGLAPGCRRYVTSREDVAAGHEIILLRRACGGWAACWPDGSVRLVRLGQGNVRRIFSEPADGVAYVRPPGEPNLDEVEAIIVELENRHRNDPGGVDFEVPQDGLVAHSGRSRYACGTYEIEPSGTRP